MSKKEVPTTVVTPKFRMSFPTLLEPGTDLSGRQVYSTSMLFPSDADMTELRAAAEAAALKKWPKKEAWAKLNRGKGLKMPFTDGNTKGKLNSDGEFQIYKGHKDTTVVNSKRQVAQGAPSVVGPNPHVAITDESEIYGGRWARAQVNAFAYDVAGNQGVAFGLNMVQLLEHDEPFAAASTPTSVFDNEDVESKEAADTFLD